MHTSPFKTFAILALVVIAMVQSAPATDYPSIREQVQTEKPVDPATYKIQHEVVVFDLWGYFNTEKITDLQAQVDVVYLVTALQGIVNRNEPRLFLMAALALFDLETRIASGADPKTLPVRDLDAFWWKDFEQRKYLTKVRRISDLAELIRAFRQDVTGLVRWEMKVPATVNAALMAAGCENLLPVSRDLAGGRLRNWLSGNFPDLALKLDLTDRFNGTDPVRVNEQTYPSSGSAKNDVYRFAIEKYLRAGAIDPSYLWYDCDAAMWGKLRNVYAANCYGHLGSRAELQHNGMFNIDFWVARRAFIYDLSPWGDCVPIDDPGQPLGTDLKTTNDIMELAYQRRHGEFGVLGGFVPWWIKYTNVVGEKHEGVPSEWEFIALGSSYNLLNEGDAAFGISNASFYMHLPQLTPAELKNPPPPEIPYEPGTTYIAFCMMDYDGSAWVNQMIPPVYNDPSRGKWPLNWSINPILHRRIPHAMRYLYEHRTPNDFFGIADDGVGYLNPLCLFERKGRITESGGEKYEQFARVMNDRYNYDLMPFYISTRFGSPWVEMAARIDPAGFGYNTPMSDTLVNGTPVSYLASHHVHEPQKLETDVRELYQQSLARGSYSPTFRAFRCILITPGMINTIMEKMQREFPQAHVRIVDLRTYFRLLKRKLSEPLQSPYRQAASLGCVPGRNQGLAPVPSSGGVFQVQPAANAQAWVATHQEHGLYLYFDVDDAFTQQHAGHPIDLTLSYLDVGTGQIELQYDSTDPAAPLEGAYKTCPQKVTLENTGQWRRAQFRVTDARFGNRQNGATDLRFFRAENDRLVINGLSVQPRSVVPSAVR